MSAFTERTRAGAVATDADGAPPGGPAMHRAGMPQDMRRLLRRATQRYHDRLDAASVLAPLLLPQVTLAEYRTAMLAMLCTYGRVDACLSQQPRAACAAEINVEVVAPYRARSPAMQHDLRAMGIEPEPGSPQAAVTLDDPPDMPTYFGMRYVIEGAQFGNRVIGRNLQAAFGTAADDICTAWQPCARTDDGWASVMAALSALETRRDVAAALRGARLTFRYFVANLCVPPR